MFCQKLFLNSVHVFGEEEDSAAGVYLAITNFYEYYENLSKDQKAKIPKLIVAEIENFSRIESINIIDGNNLETCIATRREKLLAAMKNSKEILSRIAIDSEQVPIVFKKALADIKNCKLSIKKQLLASTYRGDDSKSY